MRKSFILLLIFCIFYTLPNHSHQQRLNAARANRNTRNRVAISNPGRNSNVRRHKIVPRQTHRAHASPVAGRPAAYVVSNANRPVRRTAENGGRSVQQVNNNNVRATSARRTKAVPVRQNVQTVRKSASQIVNKSAQQANTPNRGTSPRRTIASVATVPVQQKVQTVRKSASQTNNRNVNGANRGVVVAQQNKNKNVKQQIISNKNVAAQQQVPSNSYKPVYQQQNSGVDTRSGGNWGGGIVTSGGFSQGAYPNTGWNNGPAVGAPSIGGGFSQVGLPNTGWNNGIAQATANAGGAWASSGSSAVAVAGPTWAGGLSPQTQFSPNIGWSNAPSQSLPLPLSQSYNNFGPQVNPLYGDPLIDQQFAGFDYIGGPANSLYAPRRPSPNRYRDFAVVFNDNDRRAEPEDPDQDDDMNDDFNGRSIVAPGKYPHMAALGFRSAAKNEIIFKCGGSLISDQYVLTAAHCCSVNGQAPNIVKIGDIKLKESEPNVEPQRRRVAHIHKHPYYNDSLHYNDIALIRLHKPVEFTHFVRPIRLWAIDEIPYDRVFTMGYGSTSFAQAPTNILTELDMSLVPVPQCNRTMPSDVRAPYGIVTSQVCAKDYEQNRDTCQGDSGGPLQLNLERRRRRRRFRYYLVGITSYGAICRSSYPGVYTRVSSYVDWIASIVWPEYFQNLK